MVVMMTPPVFLLSFLFYDIPLALSSILHTGYKPFSDKKAGRFSSWLKNDLIIKRTRVRKCLARPETGEARPAA